MSKKAESSDTQEIDDHRSTSQETLNPKYNLIQSVLFLNQVRIWL